MAKKKTAKKTTTKKKAAKKKTAKKAAAKKTGSKKKIEKRTLTKSFWFKLTDKEISERNIRANELRDEIDDKKEQFGEVKKKWNSEIKALEVEEKSIREAAKERKEYREVETEEIKDWTKQEVRYMVGGKLHTSRAMDDNEKQMAMTVKSVPVTEVEQPAPEDNAANDVRDVMRDETSKGTKKSAVDPKVEKQEDEPAPDNVRPLTAAIGEMNEKQH